MSSSLLWDFVNSTLDHGLKAENVRFSVCSQFGSFWVLDPETGSRWPVEAGQNGVFLAGDRVCDANYDSIPRFVASLKRLKSTSPVFA